MFSKNPLKLCKPISMVLALLMLISMVPSAMLTVFAEDTQPTTEYVTITVKDENGNALKGATVKFVVNSDTNGEKFIDKEDKTDDNGCVNVMSSDKFIENDMTLTASASLEGYKFEDSEKELFTDARIENSKQNFDMELVSTQITDVEIEGANLTYNKDFQKAVIVKSNPGDKVEYSEYDADAVEIRDGEPYVKDAGTYSFKVVVTREGYEPFEKTVETTVDKAEITDIVITGKTLNYNKAEQELVEVTGIDYSTDTVTYKVNNEVVEVEKGQVPKAMAVGEYSVSISVDRGNNYNIFEKEVTASIDKGIINLDGLSITGVSGVYKGESQDSVVVTGENDDYVLKYKLNDGEWQDTIPPVTNAGQYIVTVKAIKDENYKETDVDVTPADYAVFPFNVYISKNNQSISFVDEQYTDGGKTTMEFDENNNVFDFSATGGKTDADIVYSVENPTSDGRDVSVIAEINANTGELTIKSAGCINVIATKPGDGNYNEAKIYHNITVTSTNKGLVKFAEKEVNYTFGTKDGTVSDQSAKKSENDNGVLSYSIDKQDIGVACDKDTGKLTIEDYSVLSEELEKTGSIDLKVTVTKGKGTLTTQTYLKNETPEGTKAVYFSNVPRWEKVYVHYWNGNNQGEWPGYEMTKIDTNGFGEDIYRYYVPDDVTGLVFNNNSNEQTYDYESDISEGINLYTDKNKYQGKYGIKVAGCKYQEKYEIVEETQEVYGEDTDYYVIKITNAVTPESDCTTSGTKGANEWFTSNVTIYPPEDESGNPLYTISKTPTNFADSVEFSDNGEYVRYVYLRSIADGGITAKIPIYIKIDTTAPDGLKVDFSKAVSEKDNYKFYNEDNKVTVTFTADDVTSGLDRVEWKYIKENDNLSPTHKASDSGIVSFENNKAEVTITADEANQYRGNIVFTVFDNAGNATKCTEEGKVYVIDTISPKVSIGYSNYSNLENNVAYYGNNKGGKIDSIIEVNEANFFTENVKLILNKDGNDTDYSNKIVWTTPYADNPDMHIGKFTISGDGDYVVKLEYADYSNNNMLKVEGSVEKDAYPESDNLEDSFSGNTYTSKKMVIDTIAPIIKGGFDKTKQSISYTITEKNFDKKDFAVVQSTKNIKNEVVIGTDFNKLLTTSGWSTKKDYVSEFSTDELLNGIYRLDVDYKDLAKNTAITSKLEFTIDHENPTNPTFEYSESITSTFLNAISFGFYNPDVEVTLTSRDEYKGVESFTASYLRELGVSEINLDKCEDIKIDAVQDEEDKSLFVGKFTLPLDEATEIVEKSKQLRGNVSAYATDYYNNSSSFVTDDKKVIVVDTISPEMSVRYSSHSNIVGNELFYGNDKKGKATLTFEVNEANFFKENVKIFISKDGGKKEQVKAHWNDISTDKHLGTYKISGDGHYRVYVKYKDNSGNKMKFDEMKPDDDNTFVSKKITIDTTKPVIDVNYKLKKAEKTAKDYKNHNRKYFKSKQTAIVTITEHNFDPNKAYLKIINEATYVDGSVDKNPATGKNNLLGKIKEGKWESHGDKHTKTITYSGDANYTFDIEYKDLAQNKAANYSPDYFTVDKKAPVVTNVKYSRSVLDTVIDNVTFGFYGGKMKVEVTATDDVSGVSKFEYNYRNAKNVSGVNAELINQAIKEGEFTFSGDHKTATLAFYIPKEALGDNNQFNGTVDFTSTDRSGNTVNVTREDRIVVDNIKPICDVHIETLVANEVDGTKYYDKDITGTITINEANFDSKDVDVRLNSSTPLSVTWDNGDVDVHKGTFRISNEGDYNIRVNYTDKSGNKMEPYSSGKLTIDKSITAPDITINDNSVSGKNGGAYKNNVKIGFSYYDKNFSTKDITLTRTRYKINNKKQREKKDVKDVTDLFDIKETKNNNGGNGYFDIGKLVNNDGIYNLKISMSDKAGHDTESNVKFTVNRFGSVYEYSDYLVSLIKDGGQYKKIEEGNNFAITEDLLITEYNADKLVKDSLDILITRDGETVKPIYTAEPKIDDNVKIGESGWYQYLYRISKENFVKDGKYKITISSKDKTKNSSTSIPDNSKDSNGKSIVDYMEFTVDTKAPEIRNIINLDEKIINAQKVNVKYSLMDVGGLSSVEVLVDNQQVAKITDFSKSSNNYMGEFTVKEKNDYQNIRLIVKDLAGNVTDTNSDSFDPGELYVFYKNVTVSTNAFVRWFANKPLFYGSIGGFILVVAGVTALIVFKRRKKLPTK